MATTSSTSRARGDSPPATGRRRGRNGDGPLASERRDHLVALAAELFAQKGFQATTVREIADEAGILSGSLYHHFKSKEAIVDQVLRAFLDELVAAHRKTVDKGLDPRETLTDLVETSFATLGPHRAAITVMQNDWNYLAGQADFAYLVDTEREVEGIWITQIKRGQKSGLFRSDIDARLTYRMIRDTIWVAVRWYRPGGKLSTRALARQYLMVLFDGICSH